MPLKINDFGGYVYDEGRLVRLRYWKNRPVRLPTRETLFAPMFKMERLTDAEVLRALKNSECP